MNELSARSTRMWQTYRQHSGVSHVDIKVIGPEVLSWFFLWCQDLESLDQKWFFYEIKSVDSEHLQRTATQRPVRAGPSLCRRIYGLIARWQRDQKGFWTRTREGCHVPTGNHSTLTFSGHMLCCTFIGVWSNTVHTQAVLIPKVKPESCDRKPEEHVWSCLPGEYRISRF